MIDLMPTETHKLVKSRGYTQALEQQVGRIGVKRQRRSLIDVTWRSVEETAAMILNFWAEHRDH